MSQALWWWTRQVRALFWTLLARSALAQEATAVAGTSDEGAVLVSIRSFALAQTATVVVGKAVKGVAPESSRLVSVG